MLDAELRPRPADLGRVLPVDAAAGRRRVEVVPATVGVEGTEETLVGDDLGQGPEARRRALLRDEDRRVDRTRRIVEGDDEIERRPAGEPGVPRRVLMQQHPWCSSIPGAGRRGRRRRCAPRRGARFSCPDACSASRVTV